MNALTLKARYRNAKALRVPFHRMSPALRCMALLNEYRDLRDVARESDDDRAVSMAESSMAYVKAEFNAAREEMRASFSQRRAA